MKKIFNLLLCFIFSEFFFSPVIAGDTIHVQTFVYASNQDSVFVFPSDTIRFEKIIMKYKLRCVTAPGGAGGAGYPCGEWDYLTYTNMYHHTGVQDSTLYQAPSYIVNGISPDSIQYNNLPSWSYIPHFQTFQVNTATTSFDSTIVGTGVLSETIPFGISTPQSRSQFLWKASELSTAGLTAGNITGLRMNISTAGTAIGNLTIRMKNSIYDSLTVNYYDSVGLLTCYHLNTTPTLGWNSFQFTNAFNWDGTSNILIDISFENQQAGTSSKVLSSNTGWLSGVNSSDNDKSLFCFGDDYVTVPQQTFAPIDSFITVSFWQYGDTAHQPQQQVTFEGIDSLGRRVVNVHLPWDNSNVYWDAGNSNSSNFDRINALANSAQFEGRWNHWAFTKNSATGKMCIYLNGSLWLSGTGMTRLMKNIKYFKIGGPGNGSPGYSYDGNIDEFSIWNTDLDSTTIKNWMFKDIDATHPFYSKLRAYYQFNDNSYASADDAGPHAYSGNYFGTPEVDFVPGHTLFRNFIPTSVRPNIIFEKGVYTSVLDSIFILDSIQNPPMVVTQFLNTSTPTTPTDTIQVWSPYYMYQYDSFGVLTDSTLIGPDGTMHLVNTPYYGAPFEVVDRYELGRYITPYGIHMDMHSGFTWIYDVSDYRTLLHDSVRLTAGNWQEYLDLSFDFIKGIPPRDVLKIQNVWNGNFGMGNMDVTIPPKTIGLSSAATQFRLKTRTTGHGQGGSSGCGEFCPKMHSVLVDGVTRYQWMLWDTCSYNPLYPQVSGSGGTWIFNRGGWCPGADVKTYDWEITPFVTPGTNTTLDYNADGDTQGNYILETSLISYGAPNFSLDASVEAVKEPSKMDIYSHFNPVCSNPLITIKNTGTTPLTSLKISYGLQGGNPSVYIWHGNLNFLEQEDVRLGSFLATGTSSVFEVNISEPNGGVDQYPDNNKMLSPFDIMPSLPSTLVFELTTNASIEDSYVIKDETGNVVFSRVGSLANHFYRDTVSFAPGCYEFRLTDTGDDGLSFWYNTAQGNGFMNIRKLPGLSNVKSFVQDFGSEIIYHFSVGFYLGENETSIENSIEVYPNPTRDKIFVETNQAFRNDLRIEVTSLIGEKIYSCEKKNVLSENVEIDLSSQPAGIYMVHVTSGEKVLNRKMVMMK